MVHRQHADHESVHVGLLLADWAAEHVRRVAEAGRKDDLDLDPDVSPTSPVLARAMESTGVMLGRHPESGLVLLAELRVHLAAAGVSVDWEILGQAAQAPKNSELLTLVQQCHPETLRTVRWANGRIKESAPQILATH